MTKTICDGCGAEGRTSGYGELVYICHPGPAFAQANYDICEKCMNKLVSGKKPGDYFGSH